MDNFQYFSIKSYAVDMYWNRLTEAILIHIQIILSYGELMIIKVKTLVFCESFMSTETFTFLTTGCEFLSTLLSSLLSNKIICATHLVK